MREREREREREDGRHLALFQTHSQLAKSMVLDSTVNKHVIFMCVCMYEIMSSIQSTLNTPPRHHFFFFLWTDGPLSLSQTRMYLKRLQTELKGLLNEAPPELTLLHNDDNLLR